MKDTLAPRIDVVVLTRDSGVLRPEVEAGILNQRGVSAVVHRVVGKRRPADSCRLETIVRARNEAKQRGRTPWLMFVDDDVILDHRCAESLLRELERRPVFGALAADYLGQYRKSRVAPHIGMGATLFRRQALNEIHFRWHGRRCECQCCCDDLRRLHWGVDYSSVARARHLGKNGHAASYRSNKAANNLIRATKATGVVLAAFNGRHLDNFQHRFLSSLRESG